MDMEKVERGVYFFDLKVNRGNTYFRMYLTKEKKAKDQASKSLEIDPRRLPKGPQEGEAWVETKGSVIERIIPLAGPLLCGTVLRVTRDIVTVGFSEAGTDGNFPAEWGPPASMITVKSKAYVYPHKRAMYIHPFALGQSRAAQVQPAVPESFQVPAAKYPAESASPQPAAGSYHPVFQEQPRPNSGFESGVGGGQQSVLANRSEPPARTLQHSLPQRGSVQRDGDHRAYEQLVPQCSMPSVARKPPTTLPVVSYQQAAGDARNHAGQYQNGRLAASNPLEVPQEVVDCVHAPCRENVYSRASEELKTIGRHRLPIEMLQHEFHRSQLLAQNMEAIGAYYGSWRRSKADGNSLYRCVGVLLCEHLCRPDTPSKERATLYKAILNQDLPFQLASENNEELWSIKLWMKLLKDLIDTIERGENALQRLQYYLQLPRCDKAIVTAVRRYTATCCQLYAHDPTVSAYLAENPEPSILQYGKEADISALVFIARTFNIILRVIAVDPESGQTLESIFGPYAEGYFPVLHLLNVSEQFHILIPRTWEDVDRYNFTNNTYTPVRSGKIVDYEQYPSQR